MPNAIKNWPATLRELAELAAKRGKKLPEMFAQLADDLGPLPMHPAGYTMGPHSDTRWLGPEKIHRKWIITPVWNSTTDTHSLDVWLAEHRQPNYANLSPDDAIELAGDLIAVARTARTPEGD